MALPLPTLQTRECAGLSFLTDDALREATGVVMGFTRREGGVSTPPFDSLNLGSHVGDSYEDVQENRRRLLDAVGLVPMPLITLNQVHGSRVLSLDSSAKSALDEVSAEGEEGADGIAVGIPDVAALLCFADCVPVIVVSPSGAFCVAHAGWRGALAGIPAQAVKALTELDRKACKEGNPAGFNAYIGPHIGPECYECSPELVNKFVDRFGVSCAEDATHLNLEAAVRAGLMEAGLVLERIASAQLCTACHQSWYYSYRGSGGRCGRHGAFAGRKE